MSQKLELDTLVCLQEMTNTAHFPWKAENPPAPRLGNNPDNCDNSGICDNLGIWGNLGVCGNWANPIGTNIAKHAKSSMRAVFGDFFCHDSLQSG